MSAFPNRRALGRWEDEGGATRCVARAIPRPRDWHYLDTAATAQKPQVVLDAMMRAVGRIMRPCTAACISARGYDAGI